MRFPKRRKQVPGLFIYQSGYLEMRTVIKAQEAGLLPIATVGSPHETVRVVPADMSEVGEPRADGWIIFHTKDAFPPGQVMPIPCDPRKVSFVELAEGANPHDDLRVMSV